MKTGTGATTIATVAIGVGIAVLASAPGARADSVLVEAGASLRYLANSANPGLGVTWKNESFSDAGWATGIYGIGYETGNGAQALIATTVPSGTLSVYTRTSFTVADPAQVVSLLLGADYDDGFVAWINGVEVYRSATMPAGVPAWNESPGLHESSNAPAPVYAPLVDVTAAALPVLRAGTNLLAIGVWNESAGSSDLVLVPYLLSSASVFVTRGPYLQLGTPTSTVVRWRTSIANLGVVRWGATPTTLTNSIAETAATSEHVLTITGLAPETRYAYSVGTASETLAGADAAHTFATPPWVGMARPARFWVIGDAGTKTANQRAVRDAYDATTAGRDTDAWLMLGDNAYDDGTDSDYQAAVFDMYAPRLRSSVVWPTLGNHDARSAASASETGVYYDSFTLPRAGEAGGAPSGTEAYYSFDHGNVHFICLDSQDSNRNPGGAMLSWLQVDLAATVADWIVAFWHHPPYSKGVHDSDAEAQLIDMRENVLPILEGGGVDLVLSGHSHSYERTFLLDGHYGDSLSLSPVNILDGGWGNPGTTGAYRKPGGGPVARAGAVYTVAGSSGKTEAGPLNHPAMRLSLDSLGSVMFEVNRGRLDAWFLDEAGQERDRFSIFKGATAADIPPLGPLALAATPASSSSIDLVWNDRDANETGFELERTTDGIAWTLAATPAADATVDTDTGLAPAAYTYRVRAVNGAGPSAWSNLASATLVGCAAPGGLGNTLLAAKQLPDLHVWWTDIAGATDYGVYRDLAPDGSYAVLAGGALSGTAGAQFPSPAGSLVFLRVAAHDGSCVGPK